MKSSSNFYSTMIIFKVIILLFVIINKFEVSCQESKNRRVLWTNDLYFNADRTDTLEKGKEIDKIRRNQVVPPSFDWRDKNMVSPVKDQGACNACSAFSAIANIESHLKIQKGVEEILSEQFLIDCDNTTQGCAPASLLKTFGNIITNFGGVLRESDYYRYSQRRVQCRWNRDIALVPVVGMKRVYPDEAVMVQELVNNGPLSAAINAKRMVKYKGNYIDEPSNDECPQDDLDHTVLIVGYSSYVSDDGKTVPYWIIKNSWGVNWGDHGYYYLVRGRNACGIARDVSYAIVG